MSVLVLTVVMHIDDSHPRSPSAVRAAQEVEESLRQHADAFGIIHVVAQGTTVQDPSAILRLQLERARGELADRDLEVEIQKRNVTQLEAVRDELKKELGLGLSTALSVDTDDIPF